MKICRKCKVDKQDKMFSSDKKAKDGKQSWCKICKSTALSLYYKLHPEKKIKRTKNQAKERYKLNTINSNIARRMRIALKGKGKWTIANHVGYSSAEFKKHFESLFTKEMNWNNHGSVWEIDHKKPLNCFKIKAIDSTEFKDCWSLVNLQPLTKEDNLKKGRHYNTPVV